MQGRVPVRLLDRDAMSVRFGPGCDARGNHVGRTLWRESMHVSQRLHRCEPDLLRCELPQATIRYNGMRVHPADQRPLDFGRCHRHGDAGVIASGSPNIARYCPLAMVENLNPIHRQKGIIRRSLGWTTAHQK
jgi:hypothetical protein